MTARIQCCVPFCPCTRKNVSAEYCEWICGDHWRLVDKARRRVWERARKRWRRFGPPVSADAISSRLWAALKRQAIERAAGIAA